MIMDHRDIPIRGAEAEELPMLNIEKEEGVEIQSEEVKIQTKTKEVVKELQKTLQTPLAGKSYWMHCNTLLFFQLSYFALLFPIVLLTTFRSLTNF